MTAVRNAAAAAAAAPVSVGGGSGKVTATGADVKKPPTAVFYTRFGWNRPRWKWPVSTPIQLPRGSNVVPLDHKLFSSSGL